MSADDFYIAETLAAAAGVSKKTFERHLAKNVGSLQSARFTEPGLGVRYDAKKCRRYLALVLACPKRRPKVEVQHHVAV